MKSDPHLLLRVETDYFVAGALYRKIYGVWSCVKAAPILHWLKGKSTTEAKLALLRMNAKYEWLPTFGQAAYRPSKTNGSARKTNRA